MITFQHSCNIDYYQSGNIYCYQSGNIYCQQSGNIDCQQSGNLDCLHSGNIHCQRSKKQLPVIASSWNKLYLSCSYTIELAVPMAASPTPRHPPCLTTSELASCWGLKKGRRCKGRGI